MKAKCKKCGDTVEVTKIGEYKSCKCGAIGLDYGDGEYYYRVNGDPKDFDGEIEDAPTMRADRVIDTAPTEWDSVAPTQKETVRNDRKEPGATDITLSDIAYRLVDMAHELEDAANGLVKLLQERSESSLARDGEWLGRKGDYNMVESNMVESFKKVK